jgi:hypothetical protein
MAKCDFCGSNIWFGGVQFDEYKFCNRTCEQNAYALVAAKHIPEDYLREQVIALHQAPCPRCSGQGPVDVHTSYRIWSALVLTSWRNQPHICCRQCGRMEQLKDGLFSLFLGWWGFPWGLLVTPVQVVSNLVGYFGGAKSTEPSKELYRLVQISLGARLLESRS